MTKGELIEKLQGLDDDILIITEDFFDIDIEYAPLIGDEAAMLIKKLSPPKQ